MHMLHHGRVHIAAYPAAEPDTSAPVSTCGFGLGVEYCGLVRRMPAQGCTPVGQDAAGLGMCVGGSSPNPTT